MEKIKTYLEEIQDIKQLVMSYGNDLEEITIEGQKVYTSKTLKDNSKYAVKTTFSKQTALILIRLISTGTITPVFISKGIIDYIIKRRKIKSHNLGLAFKGKGYVFVDTLYQKYKLTSVDEKFLAKILIHETMHIADHLNLKSFVKVNHELLTDFWKAFFTSYLELSGTIPNNIFDHIIKYQINIRTVSKWSEGEMYFPVFEKLEKYSSLDEKDYQLAFDNLLKFFDLVYTAQSGKSIPSEIFKAKDYAYIKVAGDKSDTFGSELWSLSEILSVISEINPNHSNVVKTLRVLI